MRCSSGSPAGSCWPSTPTPPGRARPSAFYEWEQQLRARGARSPRLPTGVDPAELARTDPDALRSAVDGRRAVPRLPGRTGCSTRRTCSTPEGRARAAEAALAGDRRAPERPRPRPVRDAGRRPLPASTLIAFVARCRARCAPARCRCRPSRRRARADRRHAEAVVADARWCSAGTRSRPWLVEALFADEVDPRRVPRARRPTATRPGRDRGRPTPEAAELLRAPRSGSGSGRRARSTGRDRASDHERGATQSSRRSLAGPEPTDRRRATCAGSIDEVRDAEARIGSGRAVARVARGSGARRGDDRSHSEQRPGWGACRQRISSRTSSAWTLRAPSVVTPRGVHARASRTSSFARRRDRRVARPAR